MSKPSANTKKNLNTELDAEVLYQKLGDRWFAFSIVNDEVFMAPVSDDQVAQAKKESQTCVRANIDAFDIEEFDANDEQNNETV